MKKVLLAIVATFILSSSAYADAPRVQLGGDFVVPYRVDAPKSRLDMLAGGHIQGYLSSAVTADFTALFGVEDSGAADRPIYLSPGISLYLPTFIVQPYLSANLPILINNGRDIGLQGAGGLQFGLLPGILLRYSVDVAYYFDTEAYIVNWVHAGVAVSF